MKEIYADILGWAGVLLTLLAYALLNFQVWKVQSVPYQLLNIMGGLFLAASAIYHNDTPNSVVNLLWMFIGLLGLLRWYKERKAS